MDLVSLLITLIGIIVLLGLFIMSRLYNEAPVKQSDKSIKIPTYTDEHGEELSSVKADFPAPASRQPPPLNKAENKTNQQSSDGSTGSSATSKNQHVLFIAPQSSEPLDGNKVMAAMQANDLKLGLNDIYHYFVGEDKSLFSIANGIAPWTLKESDLTDKTIPGLSMIMQMPTVLDKKEAIEIFVGTGKKLAEAIDGELQNTQQQIFLATDKEVMLNLDSSVDRFE